MHFMNRPSPWRVALLLIVISYGFWSALEWAVTDDQRERLRALGTAANMAALVSVFLPRTFTISRWLDAILVACASAFLAWVAIQRWTPGSRAPALLYLVLIVVTIGAFIARRALGAGTRAAAS